MTETKNLKLKTYETATDGQELVASYIDNASDNFQKIDEFCKTDTTLSVKGGIADAKTVGDNISQLKEDIAAITPDDTTVDGKPWTSKKIVDSLCMPFEESGNPVQCYPVENYPLGVKVSWEPVQEGSGDPSPDNIRPIIGRDAVSVTRCGKNLFNKYGLVVGAPVYGEDGVISSYKDVAVAYVKVAPGAQYSISFRQTDNTTLYTRIAFLTKSMKFIKREYMLISTLGEYVKQTFTVTTDCEWIQFGMNNGRTFNYNFDVFFVAGGSPAIDEPYTGDTYNIALPETVYGGTLDVETGVVTVDRRLISKSDITNADAGTGSHQISGAGAGCFVYRLGDVENTAAHITNTKILCTSMPVSSQNVLYNGGNGGVVGLAVWWGTSIGIGTGDKTIETVSAFKEWWESNGGDMVYPLATPYTIQLTPQQISALSGVNTIYTDADGLVVTGAEDPKHTITELKNAIISLGGNI